MSEPQAEGSTPPFAIRLREPSLFVFGCVCAAAGAFFLYMFASRLGLVEEYAPYRLGSHVLSLSFAAISLVGLLFVLVVRPARSVENRCTARSPYAFLLFAYLCAFMSNANGVQLAEKIAEGLEGTFVLFATTEGIFATALLTFGAVFILGLSLRRILLEWRKSPEERDYKKLVLFLFALNFFGFILAYMTAAALVNYDPDETLMQLQSVMSHAVACLTWGALLILALQGMRVGIATCRS